MSHRHRLDDPGSWHHVYNRAIAKRPAFLCRADYRYFMACVARSARRGFIEVHAFCVMRTHFHLLVRSPVGRLDEGMKRIQNRYSRYLNRRLKRDGSLWRGRFKSSRVLSHTYHVYLVSYIDSNPVSAAQCATPAKYSYGSASRYAARRRPRWLSTWWIEDQVRERTGRPACDEKAYRASFPVKVSEAFRKWVERRLEWCPIVTDPLDDLVSAEPPYVRQWMIAKAELADGCGTEPPLLSGDAVLAACVPGRHLVDWKIRRHRMPVDAWPIVQAGLLRDLCRLSFDEIGERVRCSLGTAYSRVRTHRRTLTLESEYADRVARVVTDALRRFHGGV